MVGLVAKQPACDLVMGVCANSGGFNLISDEGHICRSFHRTRQSDAGNCRSGQIEAIPAPNGELPDPAGPRLSRLGLADGSLDRVNDHVEVFSKTFGRGAIGHHRDDRSGVGRLFNHTRT